MNQRAGPAGCLLYVRVHPRSAKARHAWHADGELHVWVTAPAVEGAANRALQQYLASALDISQSGVRIVRGEASRVKRLRIDLSETTVRERLTETAT